MRQSTAVRRAALVAAAAELLAERGSTVALTLEELVARAGTTKATFYRHFPSKAALLAELAQPGFEPVQAEARRDQLLDAALRVLRRHGVAGTTMERIAGESGVSPAALYWHFKNKDDLLVALVGRVAGRLEVPGAIASRTEAGPATVLDILAPRAMALQAEHVELLSAVLAEATSRPELVNAVYEQIIGPIWGALAGHFARAAEQGRLRPGHPLVRVVAIVGMVTFYNLVRRAFGDRLDLPPPEEAAAEFVRIFMEGVLVTPRSDLP